MIGASLATVAWLAAACAPPEPDVVLPGFRPVAHELVLEASPHFAEFDFFAAPTAGFGGCTRIVPGEPFQFSSKYRTRIYALPKGATCPEGYRPASGTTAAAEVALASGDIPVQDTGSVPAISPVEHVSTTLRIASVADGAIRLEVVDEDVDWDPRVAWVVGLAFAVGAGGILVLVRRRRARADAAP